MHLAGQTILINVFGADPILVLPKVAGDRFAGPSYGLVVPDDRVKQGAAVLAIRGAVLDNLLDFLVAVFESAIPIKFEIVRSFVGRLPIILSKLDRPFTQRINIVEGFRLGAENNPGDGHEL